MAARTRFLPVMYLLAPHPRLGGGASMGRRGVAEFGRIAGGWGRRCRSSCRRSREASSRAALWDVKMTDVVVAAAGETSVEVLLPEGGRRL